MKTAQELFDFCVREVSKQTNPSIVRSPRRLHNGTMVMDTMGVYRRCDGHKCIIGPLIPDDRYDPSIEGWSLPNSKVVSCLSNDALEHLHLCELMQEAYDHACLYTKEDHWSVPWGDHGIANELRFVADTFGLDNSVLDECWPKAVPIYGTPDSRCGEPSRVA